MISERTLRRWRRDALGSIQLWNQTVISRPDLPEIGNSYKERNERILRLTQELLDQHLMKKG